MYKYNEWQAVPEPETTQGDALGGYFKTQRLDDGALDKAVALEVGRGGQIWYLI